MSAPDSAAAATALLAVLEAAETVIAALPPPAYLEGRPIARTQGEPATELDALRRAVAQARASLAPA